MIRSLFIGAKSVPSVSYRKMKPILYPIHFLTESYYFRSNWTRIVTLCFHFRACIFIYPKIGDVLNRNKKKSCLNVGWFLCGGVLGMGRGTFSSVCIVNDGCHSGLFSFGLCPSSGIPRNTTFRKLYLFPFSGERVETPQWLAVLSIDWG
jgi:hypothetical protein